MRIGFDARMIDHPGIGRYIKNLLSAMLRLNTKYRFLIFGNKKLLTTYNLQLTAAVIIHWDPPVYSIKEQISCPFKSHGLDIIHIPHFNVPLGVGKGIGRGKEKLVVTIHDLIYTKFPQHLPFLKRKIAGYLIRRAVKKSAAIIAVSENTKNDIKEISPASSQKTEVIYEAVDPVFKIIEDKIYLERIKKKHSLPERIILFVGSLKKHKNIERLLDAYSKVKKRMPCSLVIIGRYHSKEPGILKTIKNHDVIYLGEVPAEDLIGIYNLSTILVMPSLYEGFGLPVLEAFACGLPVAASNVSSLPEVVGAAGLLFDPYNVDDMADKIYKVLSDGSLRERLVKKGFKRCDNFSWKKTAEQTLAVYEQVLR
jgi:glycosyltransferase involved in cell wall biosynthesis